MGMSEFMESIECSSEHVLSWARQFSEFGHRSFRLADCIHVFCVIFFFFFKQKTAYEMRISDWSSDVCSSDLEAEVQLLYSRQISDFFDAQVGVRYDFEPDPERAYAVLGLQGLAPQFFEIDTALFVSEKGDVSARFEAEYELLITQRLVLQPLAELNVGVQEVEELGPGPGPTDIGLGLRLRYEITRGFAPYLGVHSERDLFEPAAFTRADGGGVDAVSHAAGVPTL